MLSYANELISMTQGRGSYSMEFSHYDFVPAEIADKVIAAHKPHHAARKIRRWRAAARISFWLQLRVQLPIARLQLARAQAALTAHSVLARQQLA
jgi:hypothetical protein